MTDANIEQYRKTLRKCWERSPGKAWEPKSINDPRGRGFIDWAVGAGYLRIVDGRCMFERLPNSMLDWTEAGRLVMEAQSDSVAVFHRAAVRETV